MTEHILPLSAELLKVEDSEVSTSDIIDNPHDTNDDLLLETVLCDKRESKLKYQKQVNYVTKDKLQDIPNQINKLTSSIP